MNFASVARRHCRPYTSLAQACAVFALLAPGLCSAADGASGTVKDRSGAVIPSAQVVLNAEGSALQQTTNSSGVFSFVEVAGTSGEITASAAGFPPSRSPGMQVISRW